MVEEEEKEEEEEEEEEEKVGGKTHCVLQRLDYTCTLCIYTLIYMYLHSNKELCFLISGSQSLHFVRRSTIGADSNELSWRVKCFKDHIVVGESLHTKLAVLVVFLGLREGGRKVSLVVSRTRDAMN